MDKEMLTSCLWYSMLERLEEYCSNIAHEMDNIDDLDKDDIYFMGRGAAAILNDIENAAMEIEAHAREIRKLVSSNRRVISNYYEYYDNNEKKDEVES